MNLRIIHNNIDIALSKRCAEILQQSQRFEPMASRRSLPAETFAANELHLNRNWEPFRLIA